MFVLPPVAVLQPPKPVEGPTKRQGNLAEKNGFSMGVVKKSENLNCTGPSNNEAAGWGGSTTYAHLMRPRGFCLWFFCLIAVSITWKQEAGALTVCRSREPNQQRRRATRHWARQQETNWFPNPKEKKTPENKYTCSDVRYIIYILSTSPDWKQAPFFHSRSALRFQPELFLLRCFSPPLSAAGKAPAQPHMTSVKKEKKLQESSLGVT